MADMSPAFFRMASNCSLCGSDREGSDSSSSLWSRITAAGVRSSWDTSEVNCLSLANAS